MTDVRVRLAGPLGISAGGRAADIARLSRHDTLALAYLVVERARRVARTELTEVLWDERVPASWQALLRGSMSRLRAVLTDAGLPGALVTGRGWYQLTLPGDTRVDIEVASVVAREADALLRDAAHRVPAPAETVARARALAEAAHDVARQPFLAGVNGAWVGLRQQLLDDLRLHCLELTARAAIQTGDWTDARQHAAVALSRAPLRESVYRLLALAHCGAGDRGEALRVLAACRQVLAEELGADPSPETDELNTGLLRGRPVADLLAAVLSPLALPDRPAVTWPPALRRRAEAGPFVGRAAEGDQLREAWKRAAEGTPQVALVVGEAGAGKSRLLAEFAATVATDGRSILFGQCDGVGGAMIEALGDHLPDLARSVPHASGLAEAVRSTLWRLGRTGPVLLVMEDLHELDRDDVALLRYVLRCPDPLPLLVAGSVRTGDPAASTRLEALLAAWQSVAPVTRVELTGLAEGHLADLVRLRAGWPPTDELLSAIAAATGGNPFFVGELIHLWTSQGRTAVSSDELVLLDSSVDSIPAGVRDIILARWATLGDACRRVLSVAAVAGREVDLRVLEAVPDLSTVDVLAALEEAVAHHLLAELPAPAGRFSFVHGLVRETLYRQLTAAGQQRLHADLATAMEARPGGALSSVTQIAHHLLRGGASVSARAATAAARAGMQATARHAYDEAVYFFAAAARCADPGSVARCRRRLQLAEARWRSGDGLGAGTEFRAAAALAREAGRPDLAARAVFGAASHGPTLAGCDHAIAEEITDVLRDLPADDPYRPRLLGRLGAELAGRSDPHAREYCLEALALAEAGPDGSTVAYVVNCLNWAGLGHPADRSGLARADRMLALASAADDRHMMMEARLWRATFLLRAGQPEAVAAEATALEELAVALRQPFYLRLPLRLRAALAALDGRAEEAEALAAEVYPMERQAHAVEAETHALLRALMLASTGQPWHSWPDPRGLVSTLDSPPWTVVQAVCLAGTGRADKAAEVLAPVLADSGAALRGHGLAPFVMALLARSCADDKRWAAQVDLDAVRSVLRPWAGTHAVAGCGVASLGPVDAHLGTPVRQNV